MKTLLLLATIATPALALADNPPPLRNMQDVLRYRAARAQIRENTIKANERRSLPYRQGWRPQPAQAVVQYNKPGSTMQFGGPWNLRR